MISKLQFISNGKTPAEHLEHITTALDAGCDWIQLRLKNATEKVVLQTAQTARELTHRYNAKLIINDFPNIAKAIEAHGVHLGLTDLSIPDARRVVGRELLIGGTANTLEHVMQRISEGADYVGLGPFRFTTTKQKLSPILGAEGYAMILDRLRVLGLSIPVIAIGGITEADIPVLQKTGLHGVALSGAIIHAQNQKNTVRQIHELLC